MQRATHRPGTNYGSGFDRLLDISFSGTRRAETDSPERTEIVLGLHCAEQTHNLGRFPTFCPSNLLIDQSAMGDIVRGHGQEIAR
jgi:hypothetical protein